MHARRRKGDPGRALDKLTGKTIWESRVPDSPGAAYSSAIAIDFDGQREYVQFTRTSLVGVAASDGNCLWRFFRPANSHGINCSTAIYNDGLVFAASAYGAGGALAKLTKDTNGDIIPQEVYSQRRCKIITGA